MECELDVEQRSTKNLTSNKNTFKCPSISVKEKLARVLVFFFSVSLLLMGHRKSSPSTLVKLMLNKKTCKSPSSSVKLMNGEVEELKFEIDLYPLVLCNLKSQSFIVNKHNSKIGFFWNIKLLQNQFSHLLFITRWNNLIYQEYWSSYRSQNVYQSFVFNLS